MIKYKRGDIWFGRKLGTFTKGILSGSRPVLIISNNGWNAESPTVNVILISSKLDKSSPVHIEINLEMKSAINIEQIYTIPKKNLDRFMRSLTKEEMELVENTLRYQLNL